MEKIFNQKSFLYFFWTPLGSRVQLTPVANLPPAVHLDLRISPRIIEKFEMSQVLFSGAWGKVVHEKKSEAKNLVTLSL
jgi:hypothetical protein